MIREDYQKMILESEIFKSMDDKTKSLVLNAEGPDMDYYLGMLNAANSDLIKIKKEAIDEMADKSKKIKEDMKDESKKIWDKAEEREKNAAQEEEAKLLQSLNNK